MIQARNALAVFLISLCSFSAFAHQQKTAFIEILYNQRSEQIEVSHRFELHDAEHAVGQLFGGGADILASEETQRAFYQYATQSFSISRGDGTELDLENLGFEIEGKYFWVYQIAPIEPELTTLRLSSTVLQELWADQANWVNVKRDGEVETAVFEGSQNQIQISFD